MQPITDETGSLLQAVATSSGGPVVGLAVTLAVGIANALIVRHGAAALAAMTPEELQAAIDAEVAKHIETPAEALAKAGGPPVDEEDGS
jgi:hypothetical protein